MAQRVHDCPGCGNAVAVPDNYFGKLIACPHCQTPMDRRTGEAAGEAKPPAAQAQHTRAQQPQHYPSAAPQQQYPYPAGAPQQRPYPYPGAQYAPPPKKGIPRWAIALIVVCVVGVVGFVGLTVYVTGKVKDARQAMDNAEWVDYEDPEGMFTAKFPKQPRVRKETLPNRLRLTETLYASSSTTWEVSRVDLSGYHQFSLHDGLNAMAQELGGTITTTRQADYMGHEGLYGELDDGWIKVQIFRVGSRAWVVLAGFHTDKFDYFLENVRLTDKALGIDPLRLSVTTRGTLYQGLSTPDDGFRVGVFGGRPPHTVDMQGDSKHGLSLEQHMGDWHRLVGTPRKHGTHRVTIRVEDADGRTASEQTELEVHPLPDPKADVQLQYRSGGERVTADFADGGNLELEVGMPLEGSISLKSRIEGRDVVYDEERTSFDELPDWVFASIHHNVVELRGTPSTSGTHKCSIRTVTRIPGEDGSDALILPMTINVQPLPQELQDRALPNPAEIAIPADVGRNFIRNVRYDPGRPEGWGAWRDWSLSGEWHTEGVELPDGVRVEVLEDLDGLFPVLQFGSVPETSGVWELEVRATVRARYVAEPREIVQKIKLTIRPLPDHQVPEKLNVASNHFHFRFNVGREDSVSAPKLHITKPVSWGGSRNWSYTATWETTDIELPEGLRFEMREAGDDGPVRLHVVGTPEEAGVWEFELKGTIKVKFIDKPYEITRDVKIIVE